MEVFVPHRVKWPHEFILAGQNKDRVTYNQLSPIQWMAGFCRTIREESDMVTKEHMLHYVINLLDDATDFSWASTKARNAVLLCRMEQGEIAGWQETEKIDRVRRAHAQRHIVGQGNRRVRMGAECFPVYILIEVLVCRSKLMRIKVSHTGTFVLIVGTRKVKCSGTHRWNVGNSKAMLRMMFKKTSKWGYDPCWSYPSY